MCDIFARIVWTAIVSEKGWKHLHILIIINLNLQSFWFSGVQVADMLLELCVTELEDVATDSQSGRLSSQPVVVESSHPYTDDTSTSGTVKIPGVWGGGILHE